MELSSSVSFVCNSSPIDYVLRDQGRILIIKDALYNPSTQKYHDIELVRSGWKLLGLDWGGGGDFTGITDDAVRRIQSTYGIVLRTLNSDPESVAFWGNANKTSYLAEADAAKKYSSGSIDNAGASYSLGKKEDDVFLSVEDAACFGIDEMTLHDAIQAGIWNATSWSPRAALAATSPTPEITDEDDAPLGVGGYGSPRHRPEKTRDGSSFPVSQNGEKRNWKSKKFGEETPMGTGSSDPLKRKTKRKSLADTNYDQTGMEPRNSEEDLSAPAESSSSDIARATSKIFQNSVSPLPRGRKTSLQTVSSSGDKTVDCADYSFSGSLKAEDKRGDRSPSAGISKTSSSRAGEQIESFPSISVYRARHTPIELGYDVAPFEERRSRIIAHLDRSSPIPFSAFVDNNLDKKISPFLYNKMLDTLSRLAENPASNDPEAEEMNELLKHWFRAAYHYLEKNSKPGDGYSQILSKVSRDTKDPEEAEIKAKEIYWRRHATDFWMTLIDLFSAERVDIDPLHQSVSAETSLNPWF